MLLSNYKEDIAMRMQKRHENIVSQMKKDLRKDGEADKKRMNVSISSQPSLNRPRPTL